MILAILFALSVLSAGFGAVRVLGVAEGIVGLGLAPAAGLAVLVILSTWCVQAVAPPPIAAIAVYAAIVLGLALGFRDRTALFRAAICLLREQRLATVTLTAALVIPLIGMGLAIGGAEVPLSPQDGASHTEAVQAYRLGTSGSPWYPPGTAALFAAWLQPFPWIDSAQGAFALGLSLPSLAILTVFGLGMAVWRDMPIAAAAALLLSFTYLYPYFPQLWSGWPLALSVILVMGLWTAAIGYIERPTLRWALVAGLELGAVVLVHGSEMYTLMIVLPLVLLGAWRRVTWRGLPATLALAIVVAILSAAPYLPNLLRWVDSGGAYAIGLSDSPAAQVGGAVTVSAGPTLFAVFALDSLGIDFPIRLTLIGAGILWAFRERVGRTVVVVGMAFAVMAATFTLVSGTPVLRQVYALTYPWAMHYRLLMLVTIAQVLLAGAGGVVLLRRVLRWAHGPGAWPRRIGRVTHVAVVTWAGLMTWGLVVYLSYPAGQVLGYGDDDGAAMAWLRGHATASDVLVNDLDVDAGIWAPYKAGVHILLPRSMTAAESSPRLLIHDNVARFDQVPEAAQAACAAHVTYVYYGALTSTWDTRRFPSLDTLRASPALQEVFSHGGAVVFRTRLGCS